MDIPKSGRLETPDLAKLHLGWSTALDDKHVDLFKEVKPPPSSTKDVDILCRATVPQDWSFPLRNSIVPKLEPLCARYRVIMSLPTNRVPRQQYYEELLRSRICISPFGYGEVCGRDIEAITCGCLLIKPDMSHLRSHPDVFIPGETYVPVRWDYADLAETCARYLDRETERARIAGNAYQVLANYYRDECIRRNICRRTRTTRVDPHPDCGSLGDLILDARQITTSKTRTSGSAHGCFPICLHRP